MFSAAIYFCVKLILLQLYPAYICYKALKTNNQQEFRSLLTFWIVSITYLSFEYFSDIFLFWLPLYTEIKLILVLWLILPQTQGSSVFYANYLDPFLNTHETDIDNALLEIQAKLKETIALYGKQTLLQVKKWIMGMVFKNQETTVNSSETITHAKSPVEDRAGNNIINPYDLFSTLISSTANRFQSPSESTTETPVVEKLERSDSHDSFVNIKEGANATAVTQDVPPQEVASPSWGNYLAGWIRKPSSSSSVPTMSTEHKKQE
ncbi:Receptor expression-enhancing protein 4 [Choanephora cucurbitarum]|uniref:Protein YOP1 n=1 Tax=Choanephora cucurbitarum TaxID=101091 RepID=A0A1C7NA65_9FUNG|nr:Receptor expression-enhancing protein 4 [Choanephora cucurbitarum]